MGTARRPPSFNRRPETVDHNRERETLSLILVHPTPPCEKERLCESLGETVVVAGSELCLILATGVSLKVADLSRAIFSSSLRFKRAVGLWYGSRLYELSDLERDLLLKFVRTGDM